MLLKIGKLNWLFCNFRLHFYFRSGFGFVVVSRLEDGSYFHRVGCINEQSPASRVDFRINDEIVLLNGKLLRKVNHDNLVKMIQQCNALQIRTLPVIKWLVRLTKEIGVELNLIYSQSFVLLSPLKGTECWFWIWH